MARWVAGSAKSDAVQFISFPGDLTVGAGTAKLAFPFDIELLGVTATLGEQANLDVIADVNLNGTTVFTTQANRPKVAAGATVGTEVVPNITSIPARSPISFDRDQVGGPSPITFVGKSAQGYAGSATRNVPRPAGSQVGDIHVAFITVHIEGGAGSSVTPPAGWTQIGTAQVSPNNAGAKEQVLYTYWFRDDGSTGGYNFTVGGTGADNQMEIFTYHGCASTGSPVDVFQTAQASYNTTWTIPSLTTTLPGDMVVAFFASSGGLGTVTDPAGMTNRGAAEARLLDENRPAAGATGTRVITGTNAQLGVISAVALKADPSVTQPGADLALALRYRKSA